MNLEVVRRSHPCRWFRSDPNRTDCRSCEMLTHVRLEHSDRTLCGHTSDCGEGWVPLPDTHPEDIEQLKRCAVCFSRLPDRKKLLW